MITLESVEETIPFDDGDFASVRTDHYFCIKPGNQNYSTSYDVSIAALLEIGRHNLIPKLFSGGHSVLYNVAHVSALSGQESAEDLAVIEAAMKMGFLYAGIQYECEACDEEFRTHPNFTADLMKDVHGMEKKYG